MRVIGTAGHVDHGKSTLVAALTGTHPDRLKEEKDREMTIDLGFAWLTLPAGEEIGIVDVPGHRDFIENMLAGVAGIDASLFVVAADEGVMPQTSEHLAILDILQIQGGLIALTKIDMVDDPEWLDLIEEDVRQAVKGTILDDAPIVRVSAKTGQGLEEMITELEKVLDMHPARPDLGKPRLPIDRVFTIAGFGTVVTGTLSDGSLKVGDEISIMPDDLKGRIRGIQSHKRKVDMILPGSRTAVNITGVDVGQIKRGDVLSYPKLYQDTRRVDVQIRMLSDIDGVLQHNDTVKLFVGASEVIGRVRLLGEVELIPGQEGWLQIELQDHIVAARGDRFIIRRPSPPMTLGGGVILDPQPEGRHKRFSSAILQRLESLYMGSPEDLVYQTCLRNGFVTVKDTVSASRVAENEALEAIRILLEDGRLKQLEEGALSLQKDILLIPVSQWKTITQTVEQILADYHKANPLKIGMAREELKSRLHLSSRHFNVSVKMWASDSVLEEMGTLIKMPSHEVRFSSQQKVIVERLLKQFEQSPYSPPTIKDSIAAIGEDLLFVLIEQGELIKVSPEVVFHEETYAILLDVVKQHINDNGGMTVAEFRDRFQTSRRYALAFLEHLDQKGITVREGDVRRLRNS